MIKCNGDCSELNCQEEAIYFFVIELFIHPFTKQLEAYCEACYDDAEYQILCIGINQFKATKISKEQYLKYGVML